MSLALAGSGLGKEADYGVSCTQFRGVGSLQLSDRIQIFAVDTRHHAEFQILGHKRKISLC